MLIMSIWGLLVARLAYSLIALFAPELLYSPPYLMLVSLTSVSLGAWFGALLYTLWPDEARAPAFRATPALLLQVAALTLPMYFLLWPLLREWNFIECGFFLLLTAAPCLLPPLRRCLGGLLHFRRPTLARPRRIAPRR